MTGTSTPDDLAPLADLIAARVAAQDGTSLLVGVAGGVSVGKSTIALRMADLLSERHGVSASVVASDGFLHSTAELAARGLSTRKGFPESYDHDAIRAFIGAVRAGQDPLTVPVYDHLFYDVLPDAQPVAAATVVILEGVNVLHYADDLDIGVYVDADEPDMRRWFVRRVLGLRDEAADVPGAYLHPFATADDDAVAALAVGVWEAINLPNLREAIEPTRDHADVVVVKGPDHGIAECACEDDGVVQDLTVAAIPGFFATMGIEHKVLQRRAARQGPSTGDYERRDTLTSLAMGVGSLTIPLLVGRALRPVTPGRGKWAKALVGLGVGAAAVTTAADVVVRRADTEADAAGERWAETVADESSLVRWARRVRPSTGVAAVAAGVVAASTGWAARTSGQRLYDRYGAGHDLGTGVAATLGAIFAWDAIYYWNHRIQHESRWLWAIHVVHHSSERYNLSTALRQPVGENFGMFVPYGLLGAMGLRPSLIEVARSVNLLYQYWIHTETITRLGPVEEVFNTPSHHRVHHGSNRRYLDRNHGSILIIWDRLFGTFEREDDDEPVVYGLTKNIHTFDPLKVATHEHTAMLRAVARSRNWRERLGHVFRGPGWSPDTVRPVTAPTAA